MWFNYEFTIGTFFSIILFYNVQCFILLQLCSHCLGQRSQSFKYCMNHDYSCWFVCFEYSTKSNWTQRAKGSAALLRSFCCIVLSRQSTSVGTFFFSLYFKRQSGILSINFCVSSPLYKYLMFSLEFLHQKFSLCLTILQNTLVASSYHTKGIFWKLFSVFKCTYKITTINLYHHKAFT